MESKIVYVEIWVPEDEVIPTGHNGRIDPEYLRNLALNYTADVRTDEDIVKRAEGIGQRAYYETVQSVFDNMLDEIKAGNIEDEDSAQDWLHQTVDGHHDVIYTACAKDVLRHSNHEDALADEYGADELVRDGSLNWSGMAFAAMMADVQDVIGDLSALFRCRDCSYPVPTGMGQTDWIRDEDGLPVCKDCSYVIPDEDDPRSAESV